MLRVQGFYCSNVLLFTCSNAFGVQCLRRSRVQMLRVQGFYCSNVLLFTCSNAFGVQCLRRSMPSAFKGSLPAEAVRQEMFYCSIVLLFYCSTVLLPRRSKVPCLLTQSGRKCLRRSKVQWFNVTLFYFSIFH